MSALPWVKFYSSDWLAGTSGMTLAERGLYITLLMLMYEATGGIPHDECRLARRCACTRATFRKLLGNLIAEGKIYLRDGCLWNNRVEDTLHNQAQRSEKARESANRRWEPDRRKKKENQTTMDAIASKTHSEIDTTRDQKSESRNQKPESEKGERDLKIRSSRERTSFEPREKTGTARPIGKILATSGRR